MHLTEKRVFELLARRYPKAESALLPQVADKTGFAHRFADAILMNLWQSRGLTIEGFEIKTRRQDWLRELKDPKKADVIYQFCDKWWIVAPKDIVDAAAELPPTWGLMEVCPKGDDHVLKIKVRAPKNPDVKEPSRAFIAALLRRLREHASPEAEQEKLLAAARAEGRLAAEEDAKQRTSYELREYQQLKESVAEFEAKSGVKISRWDAGNVGEAVKALGRLRSVTGRHSNLLRVRTAAEQVIAAAEELEGVLSGFAREPDEGTTS